MLRQIPILLLCGSAAYAWLCAVAAPLLHAIRSIVQGSTRDAWLALALAFGGGLLWAAIAAAATMLAMTIAPRIGLAVLGSHMLWPAIAGGGGVWFLQFGATLRVPRFGDAFEGATSDAVLAFSRSISPRSGSPTTAVRRAA